MQTINPNINQINYIAVDGTNTNTINQNVSLSMGFFDITNKIPIALEYKGPKNRNKEVFNTIKYIKTHKR